MVKSFAAFLKESPHETNGPVSVAVYFPKSPDVSLQPLIPDIVTAVKSGVIKVRKQRITLKTLIPTQHTVSRPKILAKMEQAKSTLPLVLLDKGGKSRLLDGHHRACADIEKGLEQGDVDTLTAAQLANWQQEN